MNSATGSLYITFGGIAAFANVPILALIIVNHQLRTKYPTVAGTLIVDFICFNCLIISGILLLIKDESCIPKIISSSLPILQSVYILCSSVEYLIARYRPLFFHSPPKLYRIFVFVLTAVVTVTLLIISFHEEGLFKDNLKNCPTRNGHLFIYSVCIVFNFISLIFHLILFTSLQDFQFKYAITIRFVLISSLIFTPSFIIVLLCFFDNENAVQIGIEISNLLIAIEIMVNALLQFRNTDLKNGFYNFFRKKMDQR